MSTPILATKLYIPAPRPRIVRRPRLIDQLRNALHRKLTLISAPAGFGKTTLVSEWIATCQHPTAWLSLDEGDRDLQHFLLYFIAALQMVEEHLGKDLLGALQSSQLPSVEPLLSQQLFAENGNHVLQREDPYAVVAAILEMVELAR